MYERENGVEWGFWWFDYGNLKLSMQTIKET